ncbi:hypothetical protein [Pseudomonas sp. I8001]|uniref:hypothetical protein n=1 Tax=Pseudomonas sp. I8001 TaxID=2738825 RepID=UPI0015A10BB9|nr:hypothetical protein [Pseudomonas sp. I8001]NWB69852.1 hypothetical protein [Pseudomonas sp. I8001]
MTSPSAALSEHVQTSRRVTAPGERALRFEEYDSAGAPTGRGATFVGVEFHGLKYADLIDHKLNTPINIPLRWTNARVVESDLEGVSPEDVASVNTSLESPYSSRTIGLVQDGWLPSGMALQDNMVVMPDRCTFSELSGRFRDGAKTNEDDRDFLDLFADHTVRINPLLFALEGNVRSNPSPEVIEQQFDIACAMIRAALPLAELVPSGRGGLRGAIGIMNDTQAGMARKQEFLIRLAPMLRAPVAARRVGQIWDEVLKIADECGVPRRSLVVLAALSAVCVPNGKSPAKGLLKMNERNYSLEHAYNALADLRSLELLMHLFAMFPDEKILLCTGDKDLALFWAGIRASNFRLNEGHFECTFSPIEALLQNVTDERKSSYFQESAG